MGRRILNRKELRADFDAAERRKPEDEEVADEEGEAEEEDEEEKGDEDDEEEVDAEAEPDAEVDEDEAEAPPKKKKAKAPKAPKPVKPKSRSRTTKVTRLRLVWGVFNNSHQCVATYEYPKRKEAEAHAAKLTGDKKNTHFVQPVKEPIEEKKEKEKA